MAKQNNSTIIIIIVILVLLLIGGGVYFYIKKEKFDHQPGCPENCSSGIQCNYYKKCMSDYGDAEMCNSLYCGFS